MGNWWEKLFKVNIFIFFYRKSIVKSILLSENVNDSILE